MPSPTAASPISVSFIGAVGFGCAANSRSLADRRSVLAASVGPKTFFLSSRLFVFLELARELLAIFFLRIGRVSRACRKKLSNLLVLQSIEVGKKKVKSGLHAPPDKEPSKLRRRVLPPERASRRNSAYLLRKLRCLFTSPLSRINLLPWVAALIIDLALGTSLTPGLPSPAFGRRGSQRQPRDEILALATTFLLPTTRPGIPVTTSWTSARLLSELRSSRDQGWPGRAALFPR